MRDYERGRIYLPKESWQRAGYDEGQFARQEYNASSRGLMKIEVARAEGYLRAGETLPALMPRELRLQIALFINGGLAIVRKIRELNYDVWSRRPVVGKWDKLRIVWNSWRQTRRTAGGGGQ